VFASIVLVTVATACNGRTLDESGTDEAAEAESSDSDTEESSETTGTASCEVVEIADPSLELYVREALGIEQGTISGEAMATLTTIDVEIVADDGLFGLDSLQGLECALNLEELSWGEPSSDLEGLEPLTGLSKLRVLRLVGSDIDDFGPLASLSQLEVLEWAGCNVADLGPLAGLIQLRTLRIPDTRVEDVGPLAGLVNLEELDLSQSPDYLIDDITPLAGLTQLRSVNLSGEAIVDVSPLAGLSEIELLNLKGNNITDITPLASLPPHALTLSYNPVADIGQLASFPHLQWVALGFTQITDLSPLLGVTWETPKGCADLHLGYWELTEQTIAEDLPQICAANPNVAIWLVDPPICNPNASCDCPQGRFCG
jgi:Leucine-rich repeat (LRR) protein